MQGSAEDFGQWTEHSEPSWQRPRGARGPRVGVRTPGAVGEVAESSSGHSGAGVPGRWERMANGAWGRRRRFQRP